MGLGVAVQDGSVPLLELPLALPVVLAAAAGLVWLFAALWEARTYPATPRFARDKAPSGTRQLREDGNAHVFTDRGGFLFERRHFFVATGCPPLRLTAEFAAAARSQQPHTPVLMASTASRRFWWYREAFAWENQDLQARDVMALLHAKDRRHTRQVQTARSLLDIEQGRAAPAPRQRQPIPRDVQHEVFTRDGGCCVQCQSNFQLQYDHVIPHSLGGADTAQNLQLLCAPCNQSKGANF